MYTLREILDKTAKKELSVDEAEKLVHLLAVVEVGNIAQIDINRAYRKGIPEVILADGKTAEDVVEIISEALKMGGRAIVSRCSADQVRMLQEKVPKNVDIRVYDRARIVVVKNKDFIVKPTGGRIGILTAGTSDIPVAEEAKILAEEMGCEVFAAYDLGVAGIHRLLGPLKDLIMKDVDVIIVVAGREGAMASVVAGLVDVPVIAVPTSNNYGFGERGVSALMAMLQSCSLGLAVVNIDAGLAAGAIATLIANRVAKFRKIA